jgi:hypothetical protein
MESNVHYRKDKSPSSVLGLIHTNPTDSLHSCSPKIRFNSILPSTPRSFKWFLLFRLFNQKLVENSHLSHTLYMPYPSHRPWFDHPNNIRWRWLWCLLSSEYKGLRQPNTLLQRRRLQIIILIAIMIVIIIIIIIIIIIQFLYLRAWQQPDKANYSQAQKQRYRIKNNVLNSTSDLKINN